MKTLKEIEQEVRTENPTLRTGDDVTGYTDLLGKDYEAVITEWATNRYNKLKAIEDQAAAKAALLEKLGISEEEAKLLLK
jgi:hypothetical protein